MEGFPGGSVGKESTCSAGDQETWIRSLHWQDSHGGAWQPTPVFLPGEFHGQMSLVSYNTVHRVTKSQI